LCPTTHISWPVSFWNGSKACEDHTLGGGATATPLPLKMGLGGVPVVLPNPTQKAQLTIGGHRYDCSIIMYINIKGAPTFASLRAFFGVNFWT